jgi:diguanylate cyclase (GGDEF)-like protein
MRKISKALENQSSFFWIIADIALVGLLGIVDYFTGKDYSFSLFYLIPIALITWYTNQTLGMIISILSATTWMIADIAAGQEYSQPIIHFWNTLIRFGFFTIVVYLLSELRKSQKTEQALARIDHVTGAINSRYFHELLETELSRSRRYKHPFTLVYIDLDNFKQVNDQFGHMEGDKLIRFIVDELKLQIRNTDLVSRLGGDEFVILFPEVAQQEAQVIMSKIYSHLTTELRQKFSSVTFSAGAVTYIAVPESITETIKIADELMYTVKNGTKNDIRYSIYEG